MKANVFHRLKTACAILLLVIIGVFSTALADPRLWGNLGVQVRVGTDLAWCRAMVKDSAGNSFYVWSESRTGDPDIYAQLVSPDGIPQWTDNGVCVVHHPAEQRHPVACATDGGFVVGWIDYRTGWEDYEEGVILGGDIYAQKLDYSGQLLWAYWDSTGLAVDTDPSTVEEGFLSVVSDDSGGAIFAWRDLQPFNWSYGIYAQRILANGGTAWDTRLQIEHDLDYQQGFAGAPGGSGSMLVSWAVAGGYENCLQLYSAKITPSGETPWGANGSIVGDSVGYYPSIKICGDGSNGAYMAWSSYYHSGDQDNFTIRAQHLDAAGQQSWGINGIIVCDEQGSRGLEGADISMNGGIADGLVLIWNDRRTLSWNNLVYVQKILPSGSPAWTANGVLLADFYDVYPSVCSDQAGGLVATWVDHRNNDRGFQASASRVSAAGQLLWGDYGIYVADSTAYRQRAPHAFVLDNECFVGFEQVTDSSSSLRLQKLDLSTGNHLLSESGIPVQSGLDDGLHGVSAVPMAEGRLGIIWSDRRAVESSLYYQIMDSLGQIYLHPDGIRLVPDCNLGDESPCWQENLCVCQDGIGGFYATFEDQRYHVSAVHVNGMGEHTSDPAGVIVGSVRYNSSGYRSSYCASDGMGGCFVVFAFYEQGEEANIHVMRIDDHCQPVWADPTVIEVINSYPIRSVAADSIGSCVVVWSEDVYPDPLILRAARINADGDVIWTTELTTANEWSDKVPICPDGTGGTYIGFLGNYRNNYQDSLFVQHLSGQGEVLWQPGGVLVSTDSLPKTAPALTVNSDGNLLALWNGRSPGGDYYSNRGNLYGQKFSPLGERLWGDGGTPLCSELPGQTGPQIVCDIDGKFLAVWRDYRSSYSVAFGNYFDREARPVYDPYWSGWRGAPVSDTTNSQGDGVGLAMWDDAVYVYSHGEGLYVQRIRFGPPLDVPGNPAQQPETYTLYQNYPNPFNPTTEIRFDLPDAVRVELKVFNILGQEVTTLIDEMKPAGLHRLQWNSRSAAGVSLASGVYIYQIKAGPFVDAKKMVLIR